MTTQTNHHNFVISKDEAPENKIEKEVDMLRKKVNGFKVLSMKTMPNATGSTLVTVEYEYK